MWFSLFQIPRCNTLANSIRGNFYKLRRISIRNSNHGVLCLNQYELEGGHNRRWTRRTLSTEVKQSNEKLTSKTSKLESAKIEKRQIVSVTNEMKSEKARTKLNTTKLETSEIESDQRCIDLAKLATIICFDIETTGFRKDQDKIVEIAFQDLRGGENSTFETLVNPERIVPNEHIHNISTKMVNRYDVPRMKELIPILIQYVKSRQIPNGIVVLVSHNGRSFDVPFLESEFYRCSCEIPSDWYFSDTMTLARTLVKSKGSEGPPRISLQALREHYDIPLVGSAHRALSDVHSLALILQRLTYDLKVPVSELIKGSFRILRS